MTVTFYQFETIFTSLTCSIGRIRQEHTAIVHVLGLAVEIWVQKEVRADAIRATVFVSHILITIGHRILNALPSRGNKVVSWETITALVLVCFDQIAVSLGVFVTGLRAQIQVMTFNTGRTLVLLSHVRQAVFERDGVARNPQGCILIIPSVTGSTPVHSGIVRFAICRGEGQAIKGCSQEVTNRTCQTFVLIRVESRACGLHIWLAILFRILQKEAFKTAHTFVLIRIPLLTVLDRISVTCIGRNVVSGTTHVTRIHIIDILLTTHQALRKARPLVGIGVEMRITGCAEELERVLVRVIVAGHYRRTLVVLAMRDVRQAIVFGISQIVTINALQTSVALRVKLMAVLDVK